MTERPLTLKGNQVRHDQDEAVLLPLVCEAYTATNVPRLRLFQSAHCMTSFDF